MLTRRAVLAAGVSLAACADSGKEAAWQGGWVGAAAARGHRLRATKSGAWPEAAVHRRAGIVVVGAGIAGLAAARALGRRGVDDVHVLELEDDAGGNSRGHAIAGMACPLGAHYLPLPGPQAHEVSELLHELRLMRDGRPDERYLCHSPQERLFIDGAWVDGLLPPADKPPTLAQYRRFSLDVANVQREAGFAMPTLRAPWGPAHAALDAQTFAQWLDARGFSDERLRWYLDYCCRDDYGAGTSIVSAWAGLHYFASRHGFHAPGDEDADREPVFTWPEGNAWLARRMAQSLVGRLHTGRTVLRVSEERHGVTLLAWDESSGRAEAWSARQVVLAVPLFVAARLLDAPPPALDEAVRAQPHAPWLVANVHLDRPLVDRPEGAPPSWDNVRYGGDPHALGYVDAMHQSTRPHPGPTVLTAYWALPQGARATLLAEDWRDRARRVVDELAVVHPDLPSKVQRVDLMRHGHAMSIPVPGLRGSAALAALRGARGRVRFAHADLSGYSVFEEAMFLGEAVARELG
jgi:monoamine oxidase